MTYLLLIIVRELCEGHSSLAETEERMRRFAFVDPLTGLPSRLLLSERVTSGLAAACRNHSPLTVLFIDLDQFKAVNDTYGHHAGDELLTQTANRLKALVRDVDTVSRLGGDEFVLVLPDTGKQGAVQVAQKTCELLSDPFIIEGQPIRVTPSIGIRVYPGYGEEDCDTLLKGADRAMYRVKNSGGNSYHVDRPEEQRGRGARLNAAVQCPRTVAVNQRHMRCTPRPGPSESRNFAAAAQTATS
jgi:diguanylate cyclase (GGDEF)-like protein